MKLKRLTLSALAFTGIVGVGMAGVSSSGPVEYLEQSHPPLSTHRRDHDGEHQLTRPSSATPRPEHQRAGEHSTGWPPTTSGSPIRASRTTSPTSAAASSASRMTTSSTARPRWPAPTRTAPAPPSTTRSARRPSPISSRRPGMTWKGYFQSLPPIPPPGRGHDRPERERAVHLQVRRATAMALYASKHNPFVNFTGTQGRLANMVPDTQLGDRPGNRRLPNYSLVVPDQCHDMHGTGGL